MFISRKGTFVKITEMGEFQFFADLVIHKLSVRVRVYPGNKIVHSFGQEAACMTLFRVLLRSFGYWKEDLFLWFWQAYHSYSAALKRYKHCRKWSWLLFSFGRAWVFHLTVAYSESCNVIGPLGLSCNKAGIENYPSVHSIYSQCSPRMSGAMGTWGGKKG